VFKSLSLRPQLAIDGILLLFAVLLALFPLFESNFYTQLVSKVMIMAIFAMSLDLLVGFTGLVSFGHAAYFGIAGYVLALMTPKYETLSIFITLPAAMAVCAVFALITGALAIRTRGIFFIMVTLAFAQMAFFIFHDTKLGGGSDGIFLYSKPSVALGDFRLLDLESRTQLYYFILVLLGVVYVTLRRVVASNFGRALLGIRINEHRMRSVGFPVFRYKLAAYALSGALAGLAGYLAALQFGFVSPEILSWHQSGAVLMMVILGGMGTLYGPMIGAFVFVLLQEVISNQAWFGDYARHWQLAMGIYIILVALFLPHGLAGLLPLTGRRKNETTGGGNHV
jgi:branched-chain amino acid transport system permease protein